MSQKYPSWFELPTERWRNNPDKYFERDSQRQKLYDAEGVARYKICNELKLVPPNSFSSIEEIQKFVDKLVFSAWFKKRWHLFTYRGRIKVVEIRGGAAYTRFGGIYLPRWAWNTIVVLHEVAHCVRKLGAGASHGRYFARTFLELVEHVIGSEAMKILRGEFKRSRVKYTPKKQLSDEEKQVRRERFIQNVLNREKKNAKLHVHG